MAGVRLLCERCGLDAVSALFYRGPGQHLCRECGGTLVLAPGEQDRRSGRDRRRFAQGRIWPDWRVGADRRAAAPDSPRAPGPRGAHGLGARS